MVPPGEQSVVQLVQVAARVARRTILCDEQQITGAKAIALTEPVTFEPATCEDLLCNLLRTRGLALVPVDAERGIFEVIAMHGPRGREIMAAALVRTPEEILEQPQSKRMVLTSVKLQHATAPILVNALRPMFAGAGGPGIELSMTGQAGITLRGWQNEVASALKIIKDNDKPMAPPALMPPAAVVPVAPDLAVRVAALEKQIEELRKTVAAMQQTGK